MLCQNCGENEANVRYTQIINGVKKEMKICEKCARELGIGSFEFNMPIHFSDFLGDFFSDYNTNLLPSFVKEINNSCGTCGETYDEFVKTGLFGCPECYNEFDARIDSMLKKIHGSDNHVGRKAKTLKASEVKVDKNKKDNNKKELKTSKIEKLEEDLKIAIKEERYEDAAKIRDKIKEIGED